MSSFNNWYKFIENKSKPCIPAYPVHIHILWTLDLLDTSYRMQFIPFNGHTLPLVTRILPCIRSSKVCWIVRNYTIHQNIIKKGPISTSDLVNLCDLFKSSSILSDIRNLCMFFISFSWFFTFWPVKLSFVSSDLCFWTSTRKCSFKKAWPAQKNKGKKYIDSMVCYISMSVKMTEKYFKLGSIDNSSCDFLFKPLFKSMDGTTLINKNKR